jgi:hypothetical protein
VGVANLYGRLAREFLAVCSLNLRVFCISGYAVES